ncbi:MAG: archease [Acidobacteriota bacterium]
MPYEFFPHTADIGVRVWADDPASLFAAAAEALVEVLTDPASVRAADMVTETCSAESIDLLFHAFLSEVLFQFDARQRLVAEVSAVVRREGSLFVADVTTMGERLDPARHRIKVLIKGITYHELAVTERDGRWEATVVFDV